MCGLDLHRTYGVRRNKANNLEAQLIGRNISQMFGKSIYNFINSRRTFYEKMQYSGG